MKNIDPRTGFEWTQAEQAELDGREHRVYEGMNMSKAEELATWLEFRTGVMPGSMPGDVQEANELRRLSAINAGLIEALKRCEDHLSGPTAWTQAEEDLLLGRIRAAIAKAQGEQP